MIKPIGKMMVVVEESGEVKSASGISFQDTKKFGQIVTGIVEAIGDEVDKVKIGDKVYYLAKSGDEIKTEGSKVWYFMAQDMIKGVEIDD